MGLSNWITEGQRVPCLYRPGYWRVLLFADCGDRPLLVSDDLVGEGGVLGGCPAHDEADVVGEGAAGEVFDRCAQCVRDGVGGGFWQRGEDLVQALFPIQFQRHGWVAMSGPGFGKPIGKQHNPAPGGQDTGSRTQVKLGRNSKRWAVFSSFQRLAVVQLPRWAVPGVTVDRREC
jgi:hypothetical protein